ncbi:MAG: HI1506-related protein [Victivallales bacterium]|jgi:hypothetical protein
MPIKIKSKQNNFRRCGIPHPDQWTEYPDDRFSKAELKILKAEPMLLIEEGIEKKSAAKDAKEKK